MFRYVVSQGRREGREADELLMFDINWIMTLCGGSTKQAALVVQLEVPGIHRMDQIRRTEKVRTSMFRFHQINQIDSDISTIKLIRLGGECS